MIIVYESKTGFTRKYAQMLTAQTGWKACPVKDLSITDRTEEIIFLGWMKIGKIQGLDHVRTLNLQAVC